MKNFFKNKRILIISIFILAVLSVSIGYAFLTSKLSVKGNTGIAANSWIIYFNDLVESENNITPVNAALIESEERRRIDFDIELNNAQDTYEFNVDIVNDGTEDGMVDKVVKSPLSLEQLKYLEYTVTYDDGTPIKKCDLLEHESKRNIIVRVKLKNGKAYEMYEMENVHLSFEVDYVQPFQCVADEEETYSLTIDPKGGIFKGSTENYVITGLHTGETVKIDSIPSLEDHLFTNWTLREDEQYGGYYTDDKEVTILDKDAYVEANYKHGARVARIDDKYYPSIQAAFDDAVAGDMVWLLVDTVENPINRSLAEITLNLDGHKVEGMLVNNGRLVLLNTNEGTTSWFKNDYSYGAINNGVFTLGNKDDDGVDTDSIALIGSSYNGGLGLKQNGTFNFYDGYLEGYIGIDGMYQEIPEDYFMFVDHNDERDCQKVYLTTQPDRAVAKTVYDNGGTLFFFNLQDAFNSAMRSHLPVLAIRNFEGAYALSVPRGEEVTFDLAGWTVETGYTIDNQGTLTVKDSSVEKGLLKPSVTIVNKGNLTVDNINITETTDSDVIDNRGNLDLIRSSIKAKGGYAVNISSGDHLYMDSDTSLSADKFAVYCNTKKDFEINGGTITGVYNNGNLIINEDTYLKKITVNNDTYGVFNSGSVAVLTMKNVDLDITNGGDNTYAIYSDNNASKVIIDGGSYVVTSTSTYSGSLAGAGGANVIYNGDVTIKSGLLRAVNDNGAAKTLFAPSQISILGGQLEAVGKNTAIVSEASVSINEGKLISSGTDNAYIVYNYDTSKSVVMNEGADITSTDTCAYMYGGNVTINGGTIYCPNYIVKGSNSYYNDGSFGTVNINGGNITTDLYGVYGRGTVNITAGDFVTKDNTLHLVGGSTVNITGGNIRSNEKYGIYSNNTNTTVNVNILDSSNSLIYGYKSAIQMDAGKLYFVDGKAVGETEYGVYLKDNAVFGKDDREISITKPEIIGNYYGLYVHPNVFTDVYDGVFKGKTEGYNGIITGVADGYQLKEDGTDVIDDVLYVTCYLEPQTDYVEVVIEDGENVSFNSLQKAIDYIGTEGTIRVLKNYSIKHPVSIPSGKNITLDFDGYYLNLTKSFTNNGTLTLTDFNSEGKIGGIRSSVTKPIANNGTIDIVKGNYTTTYGILLYNKGIASLNGASLSINSSSDVTYAVYNDTVSDKTVSFTMNSGSIVARSAGSSTYGIYSVNNDGYYSSYSTINLNGGSLDVSSTYSLGELYRPYGATSIYGGNIEISDFDIVTSNEVGNARCFYSVHSLIINGGTYTTSAKYAAVSSYSNLTMNGGTFEANGTSSSYDIYNANSGALSVVNNDSILNSNHICVDTYDGNFTLNGGTLNCGTVGITASSYSANFKNVNINGGVINATTDGIVGYGTINMTGGTINAGTVGINLDSRYASTINISGGIVKSLTSNGIYSRVSNDVLNVGNVTTTVEDSEPYIEGLVTGIYLNSGTLNVDKAYVVGKTDYGVFSNGTCNFGVDENELSTLLPMIKGEKYALHINNGTTTNINDGIFKGIQGGYEGFISGFPDAYSIVTGMEEIDEKTYITNYLQEQDEFLRVGEVRYNSLQRAIDAIEDEGTIYVIADHFMKTQTILPEGKNITLDFDGHTLIFSKNVINNGSLTFKDDTGNGGISATSLNPISDLVYNNGTFIINSGNYLGLTNRLFYNKGYVEVNGGFVSNNASSNNIFAIYSESTHTNGTEVVINGGTVEAKGNGNYIYTIYNINTDESSNRPYTNTVTVNGGNIKSNSTLERSNGSGTSTNSIYGGNVTVLGGEITSNSIVTSSYGLRECNVTMNDGVITIDGPETYGISGYTIVMNGGVINTNGTNNAYGMYVKSKGTINNDSVINSTKTCVYNSSEFIFNNGTLNCGTNGVEGSNSWNNYGTFTFNDGTINAENHGITTRGKINYNGGTINAKLNGINLSSSESSEVTVTGGKIISETKTGIYGIASGNKIVIGATSDTITGNEPYVKGYEYGLYLKGGIGQFGYKNNIVDLSNCIVTGGEYGVYNDGDAATLYFYDGILKGTLYGYRSEIINEIEPGTYVFTDEDSDDETDYIINYLISSVEVIKNVRTEKEYKSIQDAIDEAEAKDVLRLIENVQLYYDVVVNDEDEVTIDFDNHSIVSTRSITNNGILNIIDSSEEKGGSLSTSLGINLLINNGSLDITDVSLKNAFSKTNEPLNNKAGASATLNDVSINSVNNILNSGVLELNDCSLIARNTAVNDRGILNINGGSVEATNYGIYSNTSGNGTIRDLEMTSSNHPLYKYSGNSKLTLYDSNVNVGPVYNGGGTLELNGGNIVNSIDNRAYLRLIGTRVADDTYCRTQGWCDYTSMYNTSHLYLENVEYTLYGANGGSIKMLENKGTFESVNSTYDINRTIDYKYCYPQGWGSASGLCGGYYAYIITNTGNIDSKGSTYDMYISDPRAVTSPVTEMYGMYNTGSGTFKTDGDTIKVDKGILSMGIYTTLTSSTNSMLNTNLEVKNARREHGIYNKNGEWYLKNTNIKVNNTESVYGIYIDTGKYTVETGSVDVSSTKTAYGIYVNKVGAEAALGVYDGGGDENIDISFENPLVKAIGNDTGIGVKKVNGYFKFYDGIIIGNTNAKPDTTTEVERNYEATNFYDKDNDYVYCRLEYMRNNSTSLSEMVARIDNTYYRDINDAINRAKTGDTILLLKPIEADAHNTNNASITLDLNHFMISGTITNDGVLTIVNGQINGGEKEALINNNRMFIGINDTDIIYDNVVMLSDNTTVVNAGTIAMYDGYIKGYRALRGNNIVTSLYSRITSSKSDVDGMETIYVEATTDITEVEFNYDYNGNEQIFVAPEEGLYKLEVWGASGGQGYKDGTSIGTPGYGGYSTGIISLNAGQKLYINVGGQGTDAQSGVSSNGGYNGGGSGSYSTTASAGGGGGATHIATQSGLLEEFETDDDKLIIVAGGGGGTSSSIGGSGGGFRGGTTDNTNASTATQTLGYSFGKGESSLDSNSRGGAGSGYFGGYINKSSGETSGTGGSGYIGNDLITDKYMSCYNCTTSTEEKTKTYTTTRHSNVPNSNYAKEGNGYVRIKKISLDTYLTSLIYSEGVLKDAEGKEEIEFSYDRYEYRLDVSMYTTYIDLTGEPSDPSVDVNKYEHAHLNIGDNIFELTVSDLDGNTKVYTVNVYRSSLGEEEHSTKIRELSFDENLVNPSLVYVELSDKSFDIYIKPETTEINPVIELYDASAIYTIEGNIVNDNGSGTTTITVSIPDNEEIEPTVYTIQYKVKSTTYSYTGDIQEYVAPVDGVYTLEAWGAQGGASDRNATSSGGGFGGYTTGQVFLREGQTIYIGVGGQGSYGAGDNTYGGPVGGYNGGGDGGQASSGSGGGASHIALATGTLAELDNNKESILIVAGGGGGSDAAGGSDGQGGSGGGYIGNSAKINGTILNRSRFIATADKDGGSGMGATQSKGFAFGQGESVTYGTTTGGAGGGYYGGYVTNSVLGGAGGGSGYFNYGPVFNAQMRCYACSQSTANETKTISTTNKSDKASSNYAKIGNGEVRITYDRKAYDNSYLASLTYSTGSLYDETGDTRIRFDKNVTDYMIKVDMYTTSIDLDFAAEDEYANVIGNKHYELNIGLNEARITVIAEDGTIRVYTVMINREVDPVLITSIKAIKFNNKVVEDIYPVKNKYQYDLNIFCSVTSFDDIEIELYSDMVSYEIEGADLLDDEGIITITVFDNNDYESVYRIDYVRSCSIGYDYTGDYQVLKVPTTGLYKLETWGAQGGYRSDASNGKGGYASGEIYLQEDQEIYVYVGGSGITGGTAGGFNGGGSRDVYPGGGGATDFRTEVGNLYTRFIVAGGGGSDGPASRLGGVGGGLTGAAGTSGCGSGGGGATQTSSGDNEGTFGQGGHGYAHSGGYGGAGGGGWYGGGGAYPDGSGDDDRAGGGGSGFVLTSTTLSNTPNGYELNSSWYLARTSLIAGNLEMPSHDGESTMIGNSGDGYAKVTFIRKDDVTKDDIEIDYYLDNEKVDEMPDNTNYFVSSECNEGASIIFDESVWNYIVYDITSLDTVCIIHFNSVKMEFDYSGEEEEFITPRSGFYKLELWGAQGGDRGGSGKGGKGAYASGEIYLEKDEKLFINVGGSGNTGGTAGGYNGGGANNTYNGGGGATDIRTKSGNLYTRFIVAAGGGASGKPAGNGGYGGALVGATGDGGCGSGGVGATQTSAGSERGSFGTGGSGIAASGGNGGSGGGGWYGGGGVNPDGSGDDDRSGGGGSSFVLTIDSIQNVPFGYELDEDFYLINTSLIAGNASMPSHNGEYSMIGNPDNGYARISYISDDSNTENAIVKIYLNNIEVENLPDNSNDFVKSECIGNLNIRFNVNLWKYNVIGDTTSGECKLYFSNQLEEYGYTGDYQLFTASKTGIYKMEVWGAQGGDRGNNIGGKGGYASGELYLTEGQTLYVYVGGSGYIGGTAGGFNGGGSRDIYPGGGGATDIRTEKNNLYTRFIVAGGGGSDGPADRSGGVGGGTNGANGVSGCGSGGIGATQTSAGSNEGSFGQGGHGYNVSGGYGGAGGGGWYGGGGAYPDYSGDDDRAGGGGSGFVLTDSSYINVPAGYELGEEYYMKNTSLIRGDASIPYSGNYSNSYVGNRKNGYARITYVFDVDNNYLDDLSYTIDSNTTEISISNDKLEYNANVSKYVRSITINGDVSSSYATIEGLGTYELDFGKNTLYVSVTAKNGDVRVYKIVINRDNDFSASTEIQKIEFNIPGVDDIYTSENVFEYSVNLPAETTVVNPNIVLFNNKASFNIRDNTELSENGTITIVVTLGDQLSSTYTINYQVATS